MRMFFPIIPPLPGPVSTHPTTSLEGFPEMYHHQIRQRSLNFCVDGIGKFVRMVVTPEVEWNFGTVRLLKGCGNLLFND